MGAFEDFLRGKRKTGKTARRIHTYTYLSSTLYVLSCTKQAKRRHGNATEHYYSLAKVRVLPSRNRKSLLRSTRNRSNLSKTFDESVIGFGVSDFLFNEITSLGVVGDDSNLSVRNRIDDKYVLIFLFSINWKQFELPNANARLLHRMSETIRWYITRFKINISRPSIWPLAIRAHRFSNELTTYVSIFYSWDSISSLSCRKSLIKRPNCLFAILLKYSDMCGVTVRHPSLLPFLPI